MTVDPRQHEIEKDEIRTPSLECGNRGLAVFRGRQAVAAAHEVAAEDVPHDRIVVYYQDQALGTHRSIVTPKPFKEIALIP